MLEFEYNESYGGATIQFVEDLVIFFFLLKGRFSNHFLDIYMFHIFEYIWRRIKLCLADKSRWDLNSFFGSFLEHALKKVHVSNYCLLILIIPISL